MLMTMREMRDKTEIMTPSMTAAINTSRAPVSPKPDTQPHVRAESFSVFYRSNQAVKEVTLDVPHGIVTAVIGPSGCGKSTLLRAVNRMNDLIPGCYVTGNLYLHGEKIYGPHVDVTALRKRVGMVFQKPNPFPKSVFDNVAYGPRIHGVRRKSDLADVVEYSLQQAALWDEVKDRLQENALGLSGGQQQRLCIARALAVEPELLLMDEPTSALDPIATDRIETLIDQLRGTYTIMIVTHNMQQAARVSDRTAFMYMGELIEVGETSVIFTKPTQQRTQDYITGRFG